MAEKKLLIRMPLDMNYFFPAVAFVHDHIMQLKTQIGMGLKKTAEPIVIELWREDQFFFTHMFPRLELVMGSEDRKLSRSEWACVIDLRTPTRALNIAEVVGKHITDAWGILYGASPKAIPELGYTMMYASKEKKWDVLVDSDLPDSVKLVRYIEMNYPEARLTCRDIYALRCSELFELMSSARLFIGQRSAATYLATMLKLGLVEYYPDDLPRTFLSQPPREDYKVVFGQCTAELIWPSLELVWETLFGTKFQGDISMEQLASIVETAAAK
jgi:hypothetical protein